MKIEVVLNYNELLRSNPLTINDNIIRIMIMEELKYINDNVINNVMCLLSLDTLAFLSKSYKNTLYVYNVIKSDISNSSYISTNMEKIYPFPCVLIYKNTQIINRISI